MKCVTFFAAGVYAAKMLSDLDILPVEGPASAPAAAAQSAY